MFGGGRNANNHMLPFNFAPKGTRKPRPIQNIHQHRKIALAQRVAQPVKLYLRLVQASRVAHHQIKVRTFVSGAIDTTSVSPYLSLGRVFLQHVQ